MLCADAQRGKHPPRRPRIAAVPQHVDEGRDSDEHDQAVSPLEHDVGQRCVHQHRDDGDAVVQHESLPRVGDRAEHGHREPEGDADADDRHQRLSRADVRRRQMRESRHDPDDHSPDHRARGEPDGAVHAHEGAGDAVDPVNVSAPVRRDDVADDAVAVAHVEELEVVGHRRHQHPQAVLGLTQMVHGERHQEDAGADVEREEQVLGEGSRDEVVGSGADVGVHASNVARVVLDRSGAEW
jgi:hypothetical protein